MPTFDDYHACKQALETLHRVKVLHNDARNPNFVVVKDSEGFKKAFILDFGRSKLQKDDAPSQLFENETKLLQKTMKDIDMVLKKTK